jgi:small subunit ribosomal protein S17
MSAIASRPATASDNRSPQGRRDPGASRAVGAEGGPAKQSRRKTKVGRVVSDKMDKTIVVSVERMSRHRLYKRVVRLTTRFKAHDEANEARIGDTVRIEESRPLSATKRWRLVAVVQRAAEGAVEQVVSEEASTTEAIHMAAHPGREAATAEAVESSAVAAVAEEPPATSDVDAPATATAAAEADVSDEATAVAETASGEEDRT